MTGQVVERPITVGELANLESQGKYFEVREGRLQEKEMATKRHGRIEAKLVFLLMGHVMPEKLGQVYTSDTTYVLEGTKQQLINAVMPDVSFMSASRESDHNLDEYHHLAPDLAIEIISPTERAAEIAAKVKTYLEFGTRQVWNVYPEIKQVIVHLPDGTSRTYNEGDTIRGGDLLPDLELKVADIFDV